MKNRSQVTIFIAVGIMLLICIGMLFYISSVKIKSVVRPEHGKEIELLSMRDSISEHVTSCLKEKVIEGYYEFGFQDPGTLENYLNLSLKPCMDLSGFERPGMEVSATDYNTRLDMTGKAVFANITMTVTLRKGDSLEEFGGFNFYQAHRSEIPVEIDGNLVEKEVHIISSDARFDCLVPAGTQLSGLSGNKIITEMTHSNHPGVYGYIVYNVEPPAGVSFDREIECTLIYEDRRWPNREEEITIKGGGITARDTDRNIISFRTSALSEIYIEAPKYNKKGMFTLVRNEQTEYCNNIEWVREIAGTNGWVTQLAMTYLPGSRHWINDFVDRAIYRELRPIIRLETIHSGCWVMPRVERTYDANGNPIYDVNPVDVSRLVDYALDIPNLRYVYVLNEPDLTEVLCGGGLEPDEYAEFFIRVAEGLHSGSGNSIYVMNAPLTACNIEWIRAMFNSYHAERLKGQIDIWASNSYPTGDWKDPPTDDGNGITCYRTELDAVNQQLGFLELNKSLCWPRCRATSDPGSNLNPLCDKEYFKECNNKFVSCNYAHVHICPIYPNNEWCNVDCQAMANECELNAWDSQCTDPALWGACSPDTNFCGYGRVFSKNVIITETSWKFDTISEGTYANYMKRAHEIWARDGLVLGVTAFYLWDPDVGDAPEFVWVDGGLENTLRFKKPVFSVRDYEADPDSDHITWLPENQEFTLPPKQEECCLVRVPGVIPP